MNREWLLEYSLTSASAQRAVDGAWTLVDRGTVCGTINVEGPATRPDDAHVPAAIWLEACNTN